MRQLRTALRNPTNTDNCISSASDLPTALPDQKQIAVLLSRTTKDRIPERICPGLDLGTSGTILRAQSQEEILAIAFGESRIKNRDIWDILWLLQQGIQMPHQLLPLKLRDRSYIHYEFSNLFKSRLALLHNNKDTQKHLYTKCFVVPPEPFTKPFKPQNIGLMPIIHFTTSRK
jgi:hypothetical protein